MKFTRFVFLLLVVLFYQVLTKDVEYKRFLRVLKFESCPDPKNELKSFEVVNFNVTTINMYEQLTNIVFRLNGVADPNMKVTIDIEQCVSTELDSCSTMLKFTDNPCRLLAMPRLGVFFNYVHPRLKCPVKDGIYKVVNFTYPMNVINRVLSRFEKTGITKTFFDHVWNINGMFFDGNNKELLCINGMGKYYQVRVRKP